MTSRCLEWIRSNCLHFTFQHLAEQIGCGDRTVRDIAYERIDELAAGYRPYIPEWLGIDETTLDGRIDACCCVLVDIKKRKPIDVLIDRTEGTLRKWLSAFGKSPQLRGVSMDMCDHYRRVVRKLFPDAEIVADRFHIERWANRAVDRVRISMGRKLPGERGSDEWKQNSHLLRRRGQQIPDKDDPGKNDPQRKENNKFLVKRLKREMRTYDEKVDFFRWLAGQPDIATAYYLKEQFCDIYSHGRRRYAAMRALDNWEKSVPQHMRGPFRELSNAVSKDGWRKEFLAYFGNKKTNGYTEAFNSVAKRVNRAGTGYSFKILRAKLLFDPKPELETVRLKPKPKSFLPRPLICNSCGRPYDDTPRPIMITGGACPVCNMPLPQAHANSLDEGYLPLEKPSDEFAEILQEQFEQDVEAGDWNSAMQVKANWCDVCNRAFDRDELTGRTSRKGNFYLICTSCLEQHLGHAQMGNGCSSSTFGARAGSGSDKASTATQVGGPMSPEPCTESAPTTERKSSQVEAVCAPPSKVASRRPLRACDIRCSFPDLSDPSDEQLNLAFPVRAEQAPEQIKRKRR
jgi:transposase